MKRLLILLIILFNVPAALATADIDFGIDKRSMEGALPQEARDVVVGMNPESSSLDEGISNLMKSVTSQSGGIFKQVIVQTFIILAIIIFCGMVESVSGKGSAEHLHIIGVLGIAATSFQSLKSIIALGQEAISNINGFSAAILPCMAAATAAMGMPAASVVRHTVTAFSSSLIINVAERLLLPLLYSYIALITANAILEKEILTRIASLIKWIIITVLSLSLTAFVAYLSLSTAISGSADAVAVKGAKFAIAGAVPVVGSIIADASETVMVSAGIIKNSLGIFGLVAVIAIFITPFLHIGIRYLCYKITAAVVSPLASEKLCKYVDNVSNVFMLMLSIVGCSTFLVIISIVSSILAGSGG